MSTLCCATTRWRSIDKVPLNKNSQLRTLLHRPVAVLVSFLAAAVFSAVALRLLPVALLPAADVPRVVVRLTYPDTAAGQVEQTVLRPLRT
ncbi:MAG: efflux RND transporter permease subunit [Catalinimonas sp.]